MNRRFRRSGMFFCNDSHLYAYYWRCNTCVMINIDFTHWRKFNCSTSMQIYVSLSNSVIFSFGAPTLIFSASLFAKKSISSLHLLHLLSYIILTSSGNSRAASFSPMLTSPSFVENDRSWLLGGSLAFDDIMFVVRLDKNINEVDTINFIMSKECWRINAVIWGVILAHFSILQLL